MAKCCQFPPETEKDCKTKEHVAKINFPWRIQSLAVREVLYFIIYDFIEKKKKVHYKKLLLAVQGTSSSTQLW